MIRLLVAELCLMMFVLTLMSCKGPEVTSSGIAIPADSTSIEAGKSLYNTHCLSCHYADSEDDRVGPGLKGVMRRPAMPVSGKAPTAENIIVQLRTPYEKMPSFNRFSDEEILKIVAYLNTL